MAAAQTAGTDAVLVMRLISDDLEVNAISASPTEMGGYWNRYYARYREAPVRYVSSRVVQIEASVFRVDDGELVWSALTRTREPSNYESVIAQAAELIDAGLHAVGDGTAAP